jgi:hypothetical protein
MYILLHLYAGVQEYVHVFSDYVYVAFKRRIISHIFPQMAVVCLKQCPMKYWGVTLIYCLNGER